MRKRALVGTFVTAVSLAAIAITSRHRGQRSPTGRTWHAVDRDGRGLGDLGRGRSVGRQLKRLAVVRRHRRQRLLRQRHRHRRGDPRLPPLEGSRGAHLRRGQRQLAQPRLLGERTYTQTGGDFKPGLDWYNEGTRRQVVELDAFARSHNVKAVTVLIGANNFGFADIVQQCVTNWMTSPSWWKNYCHDDSSISSRFTAAAVEALHQRGRRRALANGQGR